MDKSNMTMEQIVGTQLGLNADLNLGAACADFYVLETLHSQATERFEWIVDEATGRTLLGGPEYPRSFGTDSRAERFSLSVQTSLASLTRTLADEFAKYLVLACGGELRHGKRHFTSVGSKALVCGHSSGIVGEWVHDETCCKLKTYFASYTIETLYKNWPKTFYKAECGCPSDHQHLPKCKHGLLGCNADGPYTNGVCCGHAHSKSECYKPVPGYKPPSKRVKEFWAAAGNGQPRSSAWDIWHHMSADDPVLWMRDAANVFHMGFWPQGYGGEKWAIGAELAADYLDGVLKPQTFLDRCWSLQHNAGCIFNKFYDTRSPVGSDALMAILQIQAEDDYDTLAAAASPTVRSLWQQRSLCDHRSSSGDSVMDMINSALTRDPFSTGLRRRDGYPTSWGDAGCMACFWWYNETGHDDPCSEGNLDEVNGSCFYATKYYHSIGECGGCEEDEDQETDWNDIGCAACYWYYCTYGDDSPCGAGTLDTASKYCAYTDEYNMQLHENDNCNCEPGVQCDWAKKLLEA